jgi:hypothetical protein
MLGVKQHGSNVALHCAAVDSSLVNVAGVVAGIAGYQGDSAGFDVELVVGADVYDLSRDARRRDFVRGSIGERKHGSQWDHVIVARDLHGGACGARRVRIGGVGRDNGLGEDARCDEKPACCQ